MPRDTLAPLFLTLLAGLAASPLGCSSAPDAGSRSFQAADPTIAAASPAITRLRELADRQLTRPVRLASHPAPPPSLNPAEVAPLAPVTPEALAPLDTLLSTLANEVPRKPLPEPAPPVDPDATLGALRLYAQARAKANADDFSGALKDLDAAAKLDPGRPELWRLRGDVLASTAQRFGATSAYQRVLDLGLTDSRACFALATAASDRADHAAAARFAAAAIENHHPGQDPALPVLAHTLLGLSLHAQGYLHAGNEALDFAITSPLQFTSTTLYRNDLQTLIRRRSDLARAMGDAWARLGETEKALDAYALAASLPSFDPSAITERQVYVLARAGRPAEASLTLLEDIAEAALRVDDRQLELLRYLASETDIGSLLAEALGQLPDHVAAAARVAGVDAPPITPTVQGRLARAAAVIHPPSARLALERHLVVHPDDAGVAREWVASLTSESIPAVASSLIERQPLAIPTIASELARSPLWPAIASRDAAPARPSLATLAAAVRVAQGDWSGASSLLRTSPAWSTPGGLAAQALVAAAAGDVALADSRLASVTDPAHRARILARLQRPSEAEEALAPLLDAPDVSPSLLLLGSEIAIDLRDAALAESRLRQAVERDPFNESFYERLAGLHRPGAPLANQEHLFGVYRDLRQAVPSSRLLRTLNAQDGAQRGALAPAEQELTALVRQDPEDPRALQSLLTVWERRVKEDPEALSRAETFLTDLRAGFSGSSSLAIALARIQALAGRVTAAESLLRDQLAAFPSPEAAEALESLLRDPLNRASEADQHAVARLSPSPRPIGATIDLAAAQSRLGLLDDAASTLERDLPTSATLTAAQGAEILLILAEAGPKVAATAEPTLFVPVLRIADLAIARDLALTPGLHELRVALLASSPSVPVERIIEASEQAVAQVPALNARPVQHALIGLAQSGRERDALRVAIARLRVAHDAELALNAVRLVVNAGTASELREILDTLGTADQARALLAPIHPDGPAALAADAPIDEARAEIAFMVGNYLAVRDERKPFADDVYRLVLAYDPTHAMAANNLGYTLLEEGRNLDEAAALLESAYRHAPDDPNVIDSLAWLRYQQGIFDDATSPDGSVTEGAISLLRKALIIDVDGGSPVSLDHFGDALWAGGEREQAVFQWEQALSQLEKEALNLAASGRADPTHAPLRASIESKLDAAREGREPPLAPRRLERNPAIADPAAAHVPPAPSPAR